MVTVTVNVQKRTNYCTLISLILFHIVIAISHYPFLALSLPFTVLVAVAVAGSTLLMFIFDVFFNVVTDFLIFDTFFFKIVSDNIPRLTEQRKTISMLF
jgi:hypothetical protein